MDVNTICLWFHEDENINHVLLHCSLSMEVWKIGGVVDVQPNIDFTNFLMQVVMSQNIEKAAIVVVCAWKIWSAKNMLLWQ